MTEFDYKKLGDETAKDRKPIWWYVGRKIQPKLMFQYSSEVSKGVSRKYKNDIVTRSDETSSSHFSARIDATKKTTLDRGIHLYRMWFRFLKLALELEELSVRVVTHSPTVIRNYKHNQDIPQALLSGGTDVAIFRCRKVLKVKVDRRKYKGWDLDQVLRLSFDEWWKTHSQLFEGHYPKVLDSRKQEVEDDNFVYVRIDRRSQWRDVYKFMTEEISLELKQDVDQEFKIEGMPRVNVLQNNYNALILTLKGWSPKEICEDDTIYLRSTDESIHANRTKGDRLEPVIQNGKKKYSLLVSAQRKMGIWHLTEVCAGRFGKAKPKDW